MISVRKSTLHTVLILVSLCSVAFANDSNTNICEKEKAVLDQLLASGKYDARIRPPGVNGTDGPVVVRVSVYVRSTPNIDDTKQEYSVHLTLREQWVDERLKFDSMGGDNNLVKIPTEKYLSLTSAERIWMPDLFFSNEKEGNFHNMLMPNVMVRIFPNGAVLYSIRISLTLDCPMNLRLYPFDRQDCQLRIASYGYTTDDVVFFWKEVDPLEVSKSGELQGFTLIDYSSDYCSTKSIAPEYSCLKAIFSFERDLMPPLIRIYIPSCVLVLASFVSFWLDPHSVAARVLLSATTLLAMVFQISNGAASLPVVSYVKAVDIWMGVCLLFIFGTLLEFSTLNYTSRHDVQNKFEPTEGVPLLIDDERKEPMKTSWTSHYKRFRTWVSKFSRSRKIDVVSRIVFPTSFALFNLAYWIMYLTPNDS